LAASSGALGHLESWYCLLRRLLIWMPAA
jgi:hypothetical protein